MCTKSVNSCSWWLRWLRACQLSCKHHWDSESVLMHTPLGSFGTGAAVCIDLPGRKPVWDANQRSKLGMCYSLQGLGVLVSVGNHSGEGGSVAIEIRESWPDALSTYGHDRKASEGKARGCVAGTAPMRCSMMWRNMYTFETTYTTRYQYTAFIVECLGRDRCKKMFTKPVYIGTHKPLSWIVYRSFVTCTDTFPFPILRRCVLEHVETFRADVVPLICFAFKFVRAR